MSGTTQTATKGTTTTGQPQGSQPSESTTTMATAREHLLDAFEQFVDVMTTSLHSHGGGASPEVPGTGTTSTTYGSGSSTGGVTGTTGSTGSYGSTGSTTGTTTGSSGSTEVTSTSSTSSHSTGSTNGSIGSNGNGKTDSEAVARSIAGLREAYRWDVARESTRAPRRSETASVIRRIETDGVVPNKHRRDSNTAPIRETREFAPAFGKKGRPRAATSEVVAVRTPASARPETVPESVQAGVKLDAFWASYHTPLERAQERMRIIQKSEAIIGDDQRTRVANTQEYPFRCICSLLITAANGSQYIGTGWLVAPRLVLTAGHCVYMADEDGWASQIEVIPGRDANNFPYGSVIATDLRSVTGWTVDGDRDYDYGAILLPESRRLGDELGWFGYAVRPDDYFPGIDLNLSGYPGDGGPAGIDGTQWQDHRTVKQVNERQITYEIDTYGGQSGAPVWETTTDGSRYGLAIHTWGTSTSNGATRITGDVFDNISAWVGEVP